MEKTNEKIEAIDRDYIFVDATYKGPGGSWKPWRRIKLSDMVEEMVRPAGVKDVFWTIQRYQSSIRTEVTETGEQLTEKEIHIIDFVVDIDSDELEIALSDAKMVVQYLKTLNVGEGYPRVWFSGNKGFHILVPWQVMGILPGIDMNYYARAGAEYINVMVNASTVDYKIYSGRRMLRFPNTINSGSGLYKIELDPETFLDSSLDEILAAAKRPSKYAHNFTPIYSQTAAKWWENIVADCDNRKELEEIRPIAPIKQLPGQLPACMDFMLKAGAPQGVRNRATINLTCFWKDQGLSLEDAIQRNKDWAMQHFSNNAKDLKERMVEAVSVAKSIYHAPEKYRFTCASMIALSQDGYRVPCSMKDKCPFINSPEDQEPEKIPIVPLWNASKANYLFSKVRCPCLVVAMDEKSFGIIRQSKVYCKLPPAKRDPAERGMLCEDCALMAKGEVDVFTSMETPEVFKMINSKDSEVNRSIMKLAHVPDKCKYVRRNKDGGWMGNARIISITPYISEVSEEMDEYQNGGDNTRKIAIQEAVMFGHELEMNHNYMMTMISYPHPDNQAIIPIIGNIDPIESSLDTFQINDAILKRLEIFRPRKGQSVREKMNEIHQDLEDNVHRIKYRRNAAIAMDMLFHSVIGFKLWGLPVPKGWLEVLLVGDSAQGKSTMAKRMRLHYKVGAWVSGENAKRTGLVYTQERDKIGDSYHVKWGVIPQNDRMAVVIDEFTGIPKEEWGKFTELRSSGIASCTGAASGTVSSRTRLLLMCNPVKSLTLSDYRHGVESLNDIFETPADVRRVDLCCMQKKGDIPIDKLNVFGDSEKVQHVYTSDLCNNLIMWTWSRQPSEIVFTHEAEQMVLEVAKELASYYDSPKMELVESSDQKHKVARVSAAIAARLFSTDASRQKLIVDVQHVEYASEVFHMCYDAPAMRYHDFATNNQKIDIASQRQKERFKRAINGVTGNRPLDLMKTMLEAKGYNRQSIAMLFNPEVTGRQENEFWSCLGGEYLVDPSTRDWTRKPILTRLLEDLISEELQRTREENNYV